MKDTQLYVINGLLFVVSWLLVRIGFCLTVGWSLVYLHWAGISALPAWRGAFFVGFFCVGCSLNLMWGWKLVRGAIKVLFPHAANKPSKKKEN